MIEFLAENKANVNGTHGKFKRGALHLAILNGDSISTVELLINFEANINQIDREYEKTPLHYATEMGWHENLLRVFNVRIDSSSIFFQIVRT